MGQDPLTFIIRTAGEFYAFIVVLRFMLQLTRADYYNPIAQAVVRLTSKPLLPLQKILPKAGRVDLSSLTLAFLVKAITLSLLFVVHEASPDLISILIVSAASVLDTILTITFWAVLGSVIISWVAPGSYHPGPQLIQQLTEPLFALARKVIPPIGGLDLSPILIFIAIQIIQGQLSRFVM
ncbi:MAG: YggT family protein [Pontibacterium sp.]